MSPRTPPDREQRSRIAYRQGLMIAVVMLITAACQPLSFQNGFYASDLLTLDPSDSETASTDMLAVYSKQTTQTLSLRIDLLDFNPSDAPSFTLLLDTFPGTSLTAQQGKVFNDGWDVSFMIHPDGSYRLESGWNAVLPTESVDIAYDSVLDTVTLRLPLDVIEPPGPIDLTIFSMQRPGNKPADTIGPIRSDTPPPRPIPILMAFWNSFPSTTPAQALRSWDGAHNGPAGERFGLRHLLESVEAYGVPVVLADLRQPTNLAGLQFLNATPWVKDLVHRNLLSLPDTLPEELCDQASALSWPQEALTQMNDPSIRMDFETSTTLTCHPDGGQAGTPKLPPGYRYLFIPDGVSSTENRLNLREGGPPDIIRLISEAPTATQSTDAGLSLTLRQQIAAELGSGASTSVIVLSVDFQNSFWGDPRSADESMRWLAAHPWIQPLTLEALARSDMTMFVSVEHPSEESQPSSFEPLPTSSLSLEGLLPLLDSTISDGLLRFSWEQLYHAYALPSCQREADVLELEQESILACERQHKGAKRAMELLTIAIAWDDQLNLGPAAHLFPSLETHLGSSETAFANDDWLVILNPERNQVEALLINHPNDGPLPIVWNPSVPDVEIQTDLTIQVELPETSEPLKIEFNTGDKGGAFDLPLYLPTYLLDPDDQVMQVEATSSSILMSSEKYSRWQINLIGAAWTYNSIFDSPARWDIVEDPNQEMPPGHFLPIPFGRLTIEYMEPYSILIQIPDP
jgi:hypothetical protein